MYSAMLHLAGASLLPPRCSSVSLAARRCRSRCSVPSSAVFECAILEGYGLSETSPVASFSRRRPRAQARIDRAAGRRGSRCACPGGRARRSHRGVQEVAIRGHNVMKGYSEKNLGHRGRRSTPRAGFAPAIWSWVDGDGYFFIVDRKKQLDHPGRLQHLPARRSRRCCYEHPDVMEGCGGRYPARRTWARRSAPRWSWKPGADATTEDIKAFVKSRVAAYKYPRVVWFLDALPKGPTGKILRREIKPPANVGTQTAA